MNRQRVRKFEFKITQNIMSEFMLHACKIFFGCGNVVIDNRENNTKKFTVTHLDDLINIIIPFFDKYPLLTSKFLNYLSFKKAVLFVANKKGKLEAEDFIKLKAIKSTMNTKRTWEEKWNYYNTIFLTRSITPAWLVGFLEGDGCFYLYLNNDNNLQHSIEFTQSTQDVGIQEAICKFLGFGTITPKRLNNSIATAQSVSSVSRLKIRALADVQHTISIIDLCPLITTKKAEYAAFKEAINLYRANAHKTPEGLAKLKLIISNMGTKNKRKK